MTAGKAQTVIWEVAAHLHEREAQTERRRIQQRVGSLLNGGWLNNAAFDDNDGLGWLLEMIPSEAPIESTWSEIGTTERCGRDRHLVDNLEPR